MTNTRDRQKSEEVAFLVSVARLPSDGMRVRFDATEAERASIAGRLQIERVEAFAADLLVARWQADGVVVTGRFDADVVQTDVVTLDPVRRHVADDVDLVFVPETSRLARLPGGGEAEIQLDPEGDDLPETFAGDRIDLGDTLVQLLGLALDPYPRGEGVVFNDLRIADTELSPFAVLANLKRDKDP